MVDIPALVEAFGPTTAIVVLGLFFLGIALPRLWEQYREWTKVRHDAQMQLLAHLVEEKRVAQERNLELRQQKNILSAYEQALTQFGDALESGDLPNIERTKQRANALKPLADEVRFGRAIEE